MTLQLITSLKSALQPLDRDGYVDVIGTGQFRQPAMLPLPHLQLDIVTFRLHAVAYHCIVDVRGAIFVICGAANGDEGWILAFTF